jgi:membrane-bound serine protease (ClpP class)
LGIRSAILATLAEPNYAYLVLIGGTLLVYREVLFPGRVLPGVTGAVMVTTAVHGLAQSPWNWRGGSLLVASLILLGMHIRRQSKWTSVVAAGLFVLGSAHLIQPHGIHPAVALLGFPVLLLLAYSLRIASRARVGKRS